MPNQTPKKVANLEFNTKVFYKKLKKIYADMEGKGAKAYLEVIAMDGTRRLILKTPVDTGRARAGWAGWFETNKGSIIPKTPEAMEGLEKSYFETHYGGKDQYIVLQNAVEYVIYLEYGHSKQAPNGMLRITMRELTGQHVVQLATEAAWAEVD